ncbi:MAG: glucose 1-dehydrogenase [Chloroflexi bacterium]|nr:glucose 1-dehydrogenase [Chloroflexota bacterium]
MPGRLEGKVAIVTGGGAGMGAAECRLFAREGAAVVIVDLYEEGGREVEDQIRSAGGVANFARMDVTAEEEWNALLTSTREAHGGRLDVLVNNAGLSSTSVDDPNSTEGWHQIMNVNATGVYLGTKLGAAAMLAAGNGGSIVNISSIYGFVGSEAGHPAYHASKAAVRNFSKAMAVRLGPQAIRVNTVHPGFMPPMRSSTGMSEEMRARLVRAIPLGRTGEVDEVANGVLFLASDESSYVTGAELKIDGGFLAR